MYGFDAPNIDMTIILIMLQDDHKNAVGFLNSERPKFRALDITLVF